ncbi:MAG: invasin domain 3-containing protein [Desulfamplus sp.]
MKKSLMVIVYWITLFAVTLSGADVCRAANYDIEPDNDKRIYAKEVTFGDKIVGNLWHALDYDWYAVNVPYAGTVSLTAYYEFPSGSTADTDVLFVEVRSVENEVISDFFIDYMDYKTNTPYIRDINIPSSGNYYIVVHCPSQAKFKRDRYYLTMARGAGENANIFILNEEDSVSVQVHDQGGAVDARSKATLTASVTDEEGNPVAGAMVVFSRAFGDSINPKNNELVFSGKDVDSEGITDNFFLFAGEKDITVTYNKYDLLLYYIGYFKVQLINSETGSKIYLYSTTEDVTEHIITKNIPSDANYSLEVTTQNGTDDVWEIRIPNKSFSTTSNEIGTAVSGSDGKAHYTYISTDQKGDFTITAAFGNSSDKLVVKHTAGSPSKVNILDLVENPDSDLLYINREYTLNVAVTDKNGNLVEDDTEINLASSPSGLIIKNSTVKTKSGMAKFTISSATAKEYTLTATVKGNTTIKDTLSVKFNTITLSNIIAQPAYVLADGKSISNISVRLSNSNGLAVSGEPVAFITTCGNLLSNSAKTDDKGIAQVTLLAPFEAGVCDVTAFYGTENLTAPVEFYGDGTGSTTASILLETESNTVPANGTSSVVLTATLTDNAGQPVAAGTPVVFETDKGIFPNGNNIFKGSTPVGGVIKVAVLSQNGQTGKANIKCSSGGITQSIQITFTPVNVDGSPAGESTAYINLTASPATIPADGKSSLMISAELFNSKGETVPAGTEIVFYSANGKFSNGLLEFTAATTDENGKVYVALVSSLTPGPVDVWCLSNGVYQLTTVTFKDGNVTPDIGNITLSANPANVKADGASSSSITATLTDTSGNPVPAGTSVVFTAAPAGIGKFSNNTATITVKTPDDAGKVIIPFISAGTTGGLVQVSASSGGASQGTLVTFEGAAQPIATASIALTALPDKIPADGKSSLTITATLYDSAGKPMPKGTSATFSVSAGRGTFANGSASYPVTTADDSGKVSASLISSKTSGSVDVTCKSSNGITQLIQVYFTGSDSGVGSTASIAMSASPTTIPADGASSSTITIKMTDATGAAVIQGTSATLTTTLGTLSKTTVSTVDDTGTISVSLKSGTEAGTARVVCTSNGVTQAITVVFTGGTDNATPAYLSLALSQLSVKTDNSNSTTVTATVLDENYSVMKGIPVSFTSNGGQLTASLVETDADGRAKVNFSSGTIDKSNRVVTVTAKVAQLDFKTIPIQVVGSILSLSNTGTDLILDDKNTSTNESNESVLTITAKDAGDNPVYDALVSIIQATGQSGSISFIPKENTPTVTVDNQIFYKTDINGKIEITVKGLRAGSSKLIISALGTEAEQSYTTAVLAESFGIVLPVQDTISVTTRDSSTLAITGPVKTISFNNNLNAADTITITGDTFTNYNTGDQIMVGGSKSNDGIYKIAAAAATQLTLEDAYTLIDETAGAEVTITNSILIRVRAPNQLNVQFSTTMGGFNGSALQVITLPVTAGFVSIVVSSDLAGMATVEAADSADSNTVDRISVAFARPSADAATIKIQSNTAVISPSIGDNKSIAEFTAFVKTSGDTGNQAVAGVPVSFSIENSTGSGENVSPVVVYTNAAGEAKTTFTAGTLGSDADGVTVTARVVDSATTNNLSNTILFTAPNKITRTTGSFIDDKFQPNQQIKVEGSTSNDGYYTVKEVTATVLTLDSGDTINATTIPESNVIITALTHSTNIVIGGTSGSVVIGRGAGDSIVILNPTTYSLSMSVLVSDLNGNPVPGATVSLNLWPEFYRSGVWFDLNDRTSDHFVPYISGAFSNEDVNENTFLDPGEDINKDGILTPPNSAAGNIPTTLTTDANGLKEFNIIYPKSSAIWIDARIIATTMVFGTETKAEMSFTLPAEKGEAEAGYLPDSAYPYVLTCKSGGSASFRLPSFASVAYDTFTPLGGQAVGVAGTEVTDSNGKILYYTSYDYRYNDIGSPVGTIYYDYVSVSDVACATTIPVKIIIIDQGADSAETASIELTSQYQSIGITGTTQTQTTITARILNSTGDLILDSKDVIFSTSDGTLSSSGSTLVNGLLTVKSVKGIATVTLTSSSTSGSVVVTAKSDNITNRINVYFAGTPSTVDITTSVSGTMTADGVSTNTITAIATDSKGYPVPDGTSVTLQITGNGTFKNGTTSDKQTFTGTTVNGEITVDYIAPVSVPAGIESIKATTTTTTGVVTSTITIQLTQGIPVSSIEFVSATPNHIALAGTANPVLPATSTVKFLVKDSEGKPKAGALVRFELSTKVGGITTIPDAAESVQTDSDGYAQVIVSSGSVATHVRVKAIVVSDETITTVSDDLVISTGLPDQNSFSLSASHRNPEGWDYDGEAVTFTIRAADHFNNPVPDGTAIYFTTEGGTIDPTCTTVNGSCSVEWRSQNPRPADGLATVAAFTIGEESFIDKNGTGRFETGTDSFTDMPEAFLDKDDDNVRDADEEFFDFNVNGQYDFGNGIYNGTLCSSTDTSCSSELITVVDDLVLSMSGSIANIGISPASVTLGNPTEVTITLSDLNGRSLPGGTKIEIGSVAGAIISQQSFEVPNNTTGTNTFKFIISKNAGAVAGTFPLTLTVTTKEHSIPSPVKSINVTILNP